MKKIKMLRVLVRVSVYIKLTTHIAGMNSSHYIGNQESRQDQCRPDLGKLHEFIGWNQRPIAAWEMEGLETRWAISFLFHPLFYHPRRSSWGRWHQRRASQEDPCPHIATHQTTEEELVGERRQPELAPWSLHEQTKVSWSTQAPIMSVFNRCKSLDSSFTEEFSKFPGLLCAFCLLFCL